MTDWGFNGLGHLVYKRTYARNNEEFPDTVQRIVNACNTQLKMNLTSEEQADLTQLLLSLKGSVAGRFMWQLGTSTVNKLGLFSLQNCSHTLVNHPITPFTWAFDALMLGSGVGFNIQQEYINELPKVRRAKITRKDTSDADFIVPDSREGWVSLLRAVLGSHFGGDGIKSYSTKLIRTKGAPIKGFGGVASGPEELCWGIGEINNILNNRAGGYLTSVDCLDIMNIIGKVVVAGNVRRCLPEGSLVHTQRGLVPIEQTIPGEDQALTSKGYRTIKHKFDQGIQDCLTIKTQDGYFECTPNHKMAVASPSGYEWKMAKELKPEDRLLSPRQITEGIPTQLPSWTYDKPKHSTTCKDIHIPNLVDENIAWLVGLFQADGYTYPNYNKGGFNAYVSIVVGENEKHLADKAAEQLQRFGEDLHIVVKKRPNEASWMVHCQSKQLAWYFDKQIKQANQTIVTPDWIKQAQPAVRLAYVAGVADGDGALLNRPIQVVTTVYPEWAKELQTLLYSCGIESRLKNQTEEWPSRKGWQKLSTLSLITSHAQIQFSLIPQLRKGAVRINSKSKKANGIPSSWIEEGQIRRKYGLYQAKQLNIDSYEKEYGKVNNVPVEVIEIVPGPMQVKTYDIEVEEEHEFYCNGYLTHNSAMIALGDYDDIPYLKAKRWDLGNIPNWRAMSNNTVVCDDITKLPDEFWEGYKGNGEPYGLYNLPLAQSVGRIKDGTKYPDPTVVGVNPCVTGDTTILTKEGHKRIDSLVGQSVEIWNGFEWSEVTPKITGENQPTLIINFSEGQQLQCTPAHKFYLHGDIQVTAADLKGGERLINCYSPYFDVPVKTHVTSISEGPVEDYVYCFNEPKRHLGVFNGVVTGQCSEQPLGDKETCCLAEIHLQNIKSKQELIRTAKWLYRINKHSLLLKCHHKNTQDIVHSNLRMGIGITGWMQSLDKLDWLDDTYNELRAYDKEYSAKLGCPESVKLTTIKPSGTLSLLSGATPGIHPGFSRYHIRRVRMAADSALVQECKNKGYIVEDQLNFDNTIDHTTKIVEVPCEFSEGTVVASDMTAIDQLETIIKAQTEWSDNAVSCTVYFDPDELPGIKQYLATYYKNNLKAVSFLLKSDHGFAQAPLEEITEQEYNRRVELITDELTTSVDADLEGIEECEGGACPVK